jgi:hypothetical protein
VVTICTTFLNISKLYILPITVSIFVIYMILTAKGKKK